MHGGATKKRSLGSLLMAKLNHQAKANDIVVELQWILKKKVQVKGYCKIVGKPWHVALIMSDIRGFFSPINKTLHGEPHIIGLGKTSDIRIAFLSLAHMVGDLAHCPTTRMKKLVPGDDHYIGYCDACVAGAGGIWLSRDLNVQPIVWYVQFSACITSQVISNDSPHAI
jgi:hypothetical protein